MSLTTAITVQSAPPSRSLRPTGSCPRKNRRAKASLTMTTGSAWLLSRSVKSRPSMSPIRMRSKYPGHTCAQRPLMSSPSRGRYPSTCTEAELSRSKPSGACPKLTACTPGKASRRSRRCRMKSLPGSVLYPASDRSIPARSTCEGSNPRSVRLACWKLSRNRLAPISTTSAKATSEMTSPPRRRCARASPTAPRPLSLRLPNRPCRTICSAGIRPHRSPARSEIVKANASTVESGGKLRATGRCVAGVKNCSHPAIRPANTTPAAPPRPASKRLSSSS